MLIFILFFLQNKKNCPRKAERQNVKIVINKWLKTVDNQYPVTLTAVEL